MSLINHYVEEWHVLKHFLEVLVEYLIRSDHYIELADLALLRERSFVSDISVVPLPSLDLLPTFPSLLVMIDHHIHMCPFLSHFLPMVQS